ncbi:Bardet-Biedl syndrome 7 protein homolog isoform X2 [Anthonomus grandis grandis]|uniref:Bardet-Biedl syndrome 7 protein homolog isoform X2 n=1 Tax=Anthonomus grandis grandis TaxID=2921223 RepID=UPI002166108D|nr:Bardet-Biedl syndrome 7 protein homolog isoform X2 [Anthonomus grandis grandis]
MELQLSRTDYAVVGVVSKNCVKLLPGSAPKEQQKIAIADSEGILQVISVKKDDIQLQFKTLPGPPIVSLKVAGASGTLNDKIFIATGNEVKGYTKKGKLFLAFDSGMTENITSMCVIGNELFLCGRHVYSHYRDCKEIGSYLCGDIIVDSRRLTSLIACEGRMIRVLEHARVTFSIEVESSPTVLHIYEDDESKTVLFGTVDGRVGILDIESLQDFQRWLLSDEENNCSVLCMDSYDMTGNGTKNLILGRQNGRIEIYSINVHDNMDATSLIFVEDCKESIMSLQCGVVGAYGYDEVLAVTYNGRVFGLTTQVADANFDGTTGSYVFSTDASAKINKLKSSIEELQQKVNKERERYQSSTLSNSFMELSAISLIPVNHTFVLDRATATYSLIIEVPTAIDNILIECNAKIELMDVERNTAVISYNDTPGKGHHLLATYRCQVDTNRIELKIQTTEGSYGTLKAYVSPALQPKCSRLLQFDIKALSLHYRVHEYNDVNRPRSTLKIKGTFSLAEVHNWITQCLPEIPEKYQSSEGNKLIFQSSMMDTVLVCLYKKGEAEFTSDNIMSLCLIKEVLSEEATRKKAKIEIGFDINNECMSYVLNILQGKLKEHEEMVREKLLFDSLSELEIDEEENVKYLSEKYRNILGKSKQLKEHFRKYPNYLERLNDAVATVHEKYNKLK